MIAKLQRSIFWTIVISETSHVFCCVLPTLVSLISLISAAGAVSSSVSAFLMDVHDMLHAWEVPIIIGSGIVLLLGWALHGLSRYLDCRTTGCGHGPCAPRKHMTRRILWFATALFVFNAAVYTGIHRHIAPIQAEPHETAANASVPARGGNYAHYSPLNK